MIDHLVSTHRGALKIRALRWDRRSEAAARALDEITQLCSSLPRSFPVVFQLSVVPVPSEPLAGRLHVGFHIEGPDEDAVDQRLEELCDLVVSVDHLVDVERVTGIQAEALDRPFQPAEAVELRRRLLWLGAEEDDLGPVVPREPSMGRLVVAELAAEPTTAEGLAERLLHQDGPCLVRVTLTPTELTRVEMDAVLSEVIDPDAVGLTRLIRRAEGGRAAAQRVLDLLPTWDVRVVVASAGRLSGSLVNTVGATLSPPRSARLGAKSAVTSMPTVDAVEPAGWAEAVGAGNRTELGRLPMLMGPAQVATCLRMPLAVRPSFPGLVVDPVPPSELPRGALVTESGGVVLGEVRDQGRTRRVVLDGADRSRHVYVVGQTGTGKSALLERLVLQDVHEGAGVCLVDPHGDLFERVRERIPEDRLDDLVVFDPADPKHRLALNPLEADNDLQTDFIVQDLGEMFYDLFDPGRTGIVGPRFESWLRWAALTLIQSAANGVGPATLLDVPRLFTDDDYLKQRFRGVTDPRVQSFWIDEMGKTSDYHKSEMLGWFTSKFERFASNSVMRGVLESGRNDLNMRNAMDSSAIVLVNLSKGLLGEVNSSLLGYLVIARTWLAALGRAALPAEERRPFTLYLDEFQSFTTAALDAMLAESRKYGLRMVLAHQFFGQLRPEVARAVIGNVGSRVHFRVGSEDASALERYLEPEFSAQDLTYLPNYTAVCALLQGGQTVRPFVLRTIDPAAPFA